MNSYRNNYRAYPSARRVDLPLREQHGAYTITEVKGARPNGRSRYDVSGPSGEISEHYTLDAARRYADRENERERLYAASREVPCMACGHFGCIGDCIR